MTDRLQELRRKIEDLTQGLGEAQKLLSDLASANRDPKKALLDQISQNLDKLNLESLQHVEDYVAFLASRSHKTGGPGGGENQPPANEDGPGGGENQPPANEDGPGGGEPPTHESRR